MLVNIIITFAAGSFSLKALSLHKSSLDFTALVVGDGIGGGLSLSSGFL